MDLAGRVALITGGRLIGAVVATELARGGADIALVYRRSQAEAEETARAVQGLGRRVTLVQADLRDAEVIANLATAAGRAAFVEGVAKRSGGAIDAVIANAGGGPVETSVQLNYFGAVATLDGLRPLLARSAAPRAVAVSSTFQSDSTTERAPAVSRAREKPTNPSPLVCLPSAVWQAESTTRLGSPASRLPRP